MKNNAPSTHRIEYQKSALPKLTYLISVFVGSIVLCLSACSTSPMLIRMGYERFPQHMASELGGLADFNTEQIAWINNATSHHHNWHRKTQLPHYVSLLESLAKTVQTERTLNLSYFESLLGQSRDLMLQIGQCNPVLFAADELKYLSDKQIDQIRQHLKQKVAKEKKKYASNTREQRNLRRFNKLKKTLAYAKLHLNEFQQVLLRRTIDQQVSLGVRRFELTEQWNTEFIYILQNRRLEAFTEDVRRHIAKRSQLLEAAEPTLWRETLTNWRDFAAALVQSLTDKQRKEFGAWLSQMSRTLNTLAREKVQKTVSPSPFSAACSSET